MADFSLNLRELEAPNDLITQYTGPILSYVALPPTHRDICDIPSFAKTLEDILDVLSRIEHAVPPLIFQGLILHVGHVRDMLEGMERALKHQATIGPKPDRELRHNNSGAMDSPR